MRDSTVYAQFEEIRRATNAIAYHMQLGFSGEALFDETLKALLIKKGVFTEDEFKETLGEKIKEVNARDEKAAAEQKQELVTPTPAEVAKVEDSKTE